ncbi:uncharacterized protein PAE49_014685 [Odontesthes bonariensis]|uniref:uncharacterized protein LOC142397193 n=1 Tax=Odontesthes bonariensis TaxID=219752 RepID=UPI003F58166E
MDTMEIDDTDDSVYKTLVTQGNAHRGNQPIRCVAICLGLLCAVLLAGNMGQILFYVIINRPASADATQTNASALTHANDTLTTERDRLQSRYDALTADKQQLQVILSNLTKEKDQLQQSYKALTAERDELEDSHRRRYRTLKRDNDQLRTNYSDMQRSLEGLQTHHSDLIANVSQFQTKYNNLQKEKEELQTLSDALTANRDQLESNYSSLRRDKDQLQKSFDRLNMSKSHTETSYNSLWKDKNQLQMMYNTLRKEKEQLQSKCSSLAADRDQLQRNIDKITVKVRGMKCQTGWSKFDTGCYFLSAAKKNWTESREDCIAAGADLVIIDSQDEQEFVNKLLDVNQNVWIGLTDSLNEGTWMWVDGSPVTTTHWEPGQPNSFSGDQDCGEFLQSSQEGKWNDDGCFSKQSWICEK